MMILSSLLLSIALALPIGDIVSLKKDFNSPPQEYGTDCWWWWLNGNVDKQAISDDLAAMAEKGFYGAMIIDAGGHDQRGGQAIPNGPVFGSPGWCELFRYALDEAERHGLVLGTNIQSGWNLGGPCITPEYAAKHLVFSKVEVSEGATGITIPQPNATLGWYRDIAVIAAPLSGRIAEGIHSLADQTCDREIGFSTPDGSLLFDNPGKNIGEVPVIESDKVLDISGQLHEDGTLSWQVPQGRWAIIRVGYTCTGARVSTCSKTWESYVLDYLSEEAFDYYWDSVMTNIIQAAGPHVGKTFKYLSTDSWECGGMNWSGGFESYFKDFNGYDILPWLPAVAGYIVDSQEETLSFLADFRKAVGDAIATRHYGRFARKAAELGMGIQPESAGPHGGPLDGIKNYGVSDIVMSEFWAMSPHRPTPLMRFFLKQASSAAHIYGKKIIGAEAFTTIGPHWNDCIWRNHKPAFDHEICEGLNRVYFHTFTCSPKSMGLPGQEYFAGTHFNPNITWWNEAGDFVKYLTRVQTIAQQGSQVCELLYYYGDHVPNIYPLSDPLAPGFDYDVCDETTLLGAKVRKGCIILPSGRSYKMLVLPRSRVLSPAALDKIAYLLKHGAIILGDKPLRKMTLKGYNASFSSLADRIWGDSAKGAHRYERGTVVCGMSAGEYLAEKGYTPDCECGDLHWVHYSFHDGECYFLSNQSDKAVAVPVRFRVSGKGPEIWNAVNGQISECQEFIQTEETTLVPLEFGPYDSKIMVFAGKGSSASKTGDSVKTAASSYAKASRSEGLRLDKWEVFFDPALGGPGKVTFDKLYDWTKSDIPGIRYYSGPAVYSCAFEWTDDNLDATLSLGEVLDTGIASVSLNGEKLGTVWTWPFTMQLGSALKQGSNYLEIKVINSWYNRIAGDRLDPSKAWGTRTNVAIDINKLSPSGLLGPVEITAKAPQGT